MPLLLRCFCSSFCRLSFLFFEIFEPLFQAAKFTIACIGLFLAAFASEWVGYLRRLVFRADSSWPQGRRFWMVLLYAVQVTSGYFLMLAAMTYQVNSKRLRIRSRKSVLGVQHGLNLFASLPNRVHVPLLCNCFLPRFFFFIAL